MTRTALLQLTIIVLLVCAAVSGLLWWYVQQADVHLQQLNITRDAKRAELGNLSQMTEAQAKLDSLTLDERETTQLALLRHLGLESVPINFQVISREARPSGDTTLITRAISLQMVNNYAEHMALLDKLFGNGKIQLNKVTMMRTENPEISDPVDMTVEGMIYSLEKTLVPVSETAPVQAAPDDSATVATPALVTVVDDAPEPVSGTSPEPEENDMPKGPINPDDTDMNDAPILPSGTVPPDVQDNAPISEVRS